MENEAALDGKTIQEDAAAGGDRAERAFRALFARFYRRMVVYAATFAAVPPAEREDLAQDIIIRAFSKLDRYDSRRPLSSWMYGVARNRIVDFLRSRKIVLVSANEETLFAPGSFELLAEQKDQLESIYRAIQSMNETDRRIAMLVFYEELSPSDAAAALGMPAGTLRWRLMKIRKSLRVFRGEDA